MASPDHAAVVREGDELERECDYCDGLGWYGEPDHGPDCTPDKCGAPCPVERQVPCPSCAGSGRRL